MSHGPIPLMYFTNGRVRGGAEEHILTLLRGLDHNLYQMHLVCNPQVAESLAADVPSDVELLPLLYFRPSHVRSAFRLRRWIRERHIRILHSHSSYSSWFASPVGKSCGVPLIVETPHIREVWRKGWKANYAVDRFAGRFVDYFIGVSYANATYLIEEKGLPKKKVRVIQNGSDLSRFSPEHVVPEFMRVELGFEKDDPIILVAARFDAQKGHTVLLNAMPEVLRQFPNAVGKL